MFYNTYVDTLFVKAFDEKMLKEFAKFLNYELIPIVIANFAIVFLKFIHLLSKRERILST